MSRGIGVGLYQPGTTPPHRLPPGPKVVALAVVSVTIVAVRSMPAAFGFLAVALGLAVLTGVSLRLLVRSTRPVLVAAAVVAGFQWWFYGRDKAIETLVDLVALAVLALCLTASTPVNAMLDAVVRWLGPFRRFGVAPERVSLAFALAIAALPGMVELALETRDAARARGLGRHPRSYLTPFVVRVVGRAQETGDALQARGLGD